MLKPTFLFLYNKPIKLKDSKMSYNKFLNKINRDLNIYAHNSA